MLLYKKLLLMTFGMTLVLRQSALTNSQTFVAFLSSHCIVTKSRCGHFVRFGRSVTEFDGNSLILQISN